MLATTKEQIKRVTLSYCKETLANNKPPAGYEDYIKKKKYMFEKKLLECNGSFSPKEETFDLLVRKFKKV